MLQFDTGNLFDNSADIAELKNDAYVYAFNKIGLTAMNVSEREMFVGIDKLNEFKKKTHFPLLSSNLVYETSKKPVFDQELVLKEKLDGVGTIKIGILAFTKNVPSNVSSTWQTSSGDKIKTDDFMEVAKKMIPDLRKKVDLLIVLARLEHQEAVNLATEIPGIDIILATFGGERSTEPIKIKDTIVFYNGYEGKWLGELRLVIDKKKKMKTFENDFIFLTKDYPEDPEMAQYVSDTQGKIQQSYNKRAEEQRKMIDEQQKKQQEEQQKSPQQPPAGQEQPKK